MKDGEHPAAVPGCKTCMELCSPQGAFCREKDLSMSPTWQNQQQVRIGDIEPGIELDPANTARLVLAGYKSRPTPLQPAHHHPLPAPYRRQPRADCGQDMQGTPESHPNFSNTLQCFAKRVAKYLLIFVLRSISHICKSLKDKHSDIEVPAQFPEALALHPFLGKNFSPFFVGFVGGFFSLQNSCFITSLF